MILTAIKLSVLISLLNILITHALLTRRKSITYCLVVYFLLTLFAYCIGYLVAINIQNPVIAKYILYLICFFYIGGYIHLIFSESVSKKIFTLFSIWIFSLSVYFIAITVGELLSSMVDEKYIHNLIYIIRMGFQILLLLAAYWLSKYYKNVLDLVPDKVINLMSLYPITAFLLLINNYAISFTDFRNFDSIYDILLFLVFVIIGYLLVFGGISASSKVKLQYYMANYDHLTGIANRANIMNQLAKTIEISNRSKQKFALLIFDFDEFKKINDKYGHLIGDQALKYAVQKVQKVLRNTDFTGRFGGDEFVIIQQFIKNESDVETLINRIFEELKTPLIVDDNAILINISIGVSIFPDYTSDLEHLISQADYAMYEAKKREGCAFNFCASRQLTNS